MRLLRVRVVRPEQRTLGVDDNLISYGIAVLGKGVMPNGRGILGLVAAGKGKFEFGGDAPAERIGRVKRLERAVIIIDATQFGGHGAVDAPIDGGHHMTNNVRTVHKASSERITARWKRTHTL